MVKWQRAREGEAGDPPGAPKGPQTAPLASSLALEGVPKFVPDTQPRVCDLGTAGTEPGWICPQMVVGTRGHLTVGILGWLLLLGWQRSRNLGGDVTTGGCPRAVTGSGGGGTPGTPGAPKGPQTAAWASSLALGRGWGSPQICPRHVAAIQARVCDLGTAVTEPGWVCPQIVVGTTGHPSATRGSAPFGDFGVALAVGVAKEQELGGDVTAGGCPKCPSTVTGSGGGGTPGWHRGESPACCPCWLTWPQEWVGGFILSPRAATSWPVEVKFSLQKKNVFKKKKSPDLKLKPNPFCLRGWSARPLIKRLPHIPRSSFRSSLGAAPEGSG